MKRLTIAALAALILVPTGTSAQTRKRSTSPSTASAASRAAVVRNSGATRVGDQIKNLSRFIYLLGGVAKGLEQVEEAARRNEASPAVLQQAEQSKVTVRTSIRNVREGLDKLEIDFRATPELQPYYIKLAGSAAGAATAEQQASNSQFDAAGRSLLGVINRLTDVLLIMR
ncbi:MAG TPA: hypothetical protein VLA93_13880 [Pyrinomonadaceae bacterium]|nr:hypothetical protein [Pyrinomonadaceae bacterium]